MTKLTREEIDKAWDVACRQQWPAGASYFRVPVDRPFTMRPPTEGELCRPVEHPVATFERHKVWVLEGDIVREWVECQGVVVAERIRPAHA